MWGHIKTISIVTIVALLLWAFLEAESLSQGELIAEVVVQGEPGALLVVDVVEGSGDQTRVVESVVRPTLVLEGSAAAISRVRATFPRPLRLTPDTPGFPTTPGRHEVALRDLFRNLPELRESGVTVVRVEPPRLTVRVDELVTRTLPIVVEVQGGELEGVAEVSPAQVSVTLPKSEAGRLAEGDAVMLRIEASVMERLVPGRRESLAGQRLALPAPIAGLAHTTMTPSRADVALTVRAREVTVRLASVPVHLRIPPAELSNWEIRVPEADQFISDVAVTGPADQVRGIQSGTVQVVAVVSLSFEELERGIASKEAVFVGLPPSVRADAARRTIRLTITRRSGPAGP